MRSVSTRWSLNITHHQRLEGIKKQLAGKYQAHSLAFCHLKFGKLMSAVKQPIWYVYNSIPEQNMAFCHFLKICICLEIKLVYKNITIGCRYGLKKNMLDVLPNEILPLFYLNMFIVLYSIVPIIKNLNYSFSIMTFFFFNVCWQQTEEL